MTRHDTRAHSPSPRRASRPGCAPQVVPHHRAPGRPFAYYNEIDPFAAQWLRNLIAAGLLPAGEVDERSIVDVQPEDLKGFTQCHFFAGIGGWPYALRLAGWSDEREVWTGSCPCQPLSSAGQRKGHADERHLWPAFYRLIEKRRPPVVFGEQVASLDGREWFAGIRSDLEDAGYACGGADLCAAGVSAPHVRQRIFWVADADGRHASAQRQRRSGQHGFWSQDTIAIPCTDGRTRRAPSEPSFQPLADGVPGRLGQLRAYGNAIVPAVAAKFVEAFLDARRPFSQEP